MADELKCPQCERTFKNALAVRMHVIRGHSQKKWSTKKGQKQHWRKAAKGEFPCPQCDFVAQWQGGLKNHMRVHQPNVVKGAKLAQATQNAQIAVSNGSAPASHDRDHRLEAAATFASGRIAQLLESIALQHDVSYKPLTALVLRVIHAQTLR